MRISKHLILLITVLLLTTTLQAEITEVGSIGDEYNDIRKIYVDGDYAYFIDYRTLCIYDISDPTDPTQVAEVDEYRGRCYIAKQGNYLYVADYLREELYIYDVSDPTDPITILLEDNIIYYRPRDIAVEGDFLYIAGSRTLDKYRIAELENRGVYPNDNTLFFDSDLRHLDVQGEIGVVGGNYFLGIVNVSNWGVLSVLQSDNIGGIKDVDIVGERVYTVSTQGVVIIDISDPTQPEELCFYDAEARTKDIEVAGNYAFLACQFTGLKVIDIANPEEIELVETYGTNGRATNNITVHNGLAYLSAEYGVLILDVSEYTTQPEGSPEISVDPAELDFGDVEFWRSGTASVTISSVGNADLTVSDITISGDNFSYEFGGEFVLAPEEEAVVEVSVIAGEMGEMTGELTITSDDPENGEVTVGLICNGVWIPPADLLGRMIDDVADLGLNRGRTNALTVKLEHAIRRMDRGQLRPALNQLNAFTNQVNDFVEDGVLTDEQGDALLTELGFILDLINEYGIDGEGFALNLLTPSDFSISKPYPNPFNATTTIEFGLPEAADVSIEVFDLNGQLVATLVNSSLSAGYHHVQWNAGMVSTGTYIVSMNSNSFRSIQKVVLIK